MGGRGTYSTGQTPEQHYHSVGMIKGVKVLEPNEGGGWKLPEESNTSHAYILLYPDGTFHQFRGYNEDHTAAFDIDYHRKKELGSGRKMILHVHFYEMKNGVLTRDDGRFLTNDEYKTFRKYFVGVPKGAHRP